MKTYKFHVNVIQDDVTICELQFERQVSEEMYARTAAKDYVRSLNFPKYTWFNIGWQEEVADDEDNFCSHNPINESGFFNWEVPKLTVPQIIELKMESIEEVRNG